LVTFGPVLESPARRSGVTKSEFVDQFAAQSGLSKGDATKAVDSFVDLVTETLRRGGEVNFTGFGKFSVADRGARLGVNPQTGERIQIPATRVPRFSPGAALKSAVKG
jgi:DNA-binding protein HU-beta